VLDSCWRAVKVLIKISVLMPTSTVNKTAKHDVAKEVCTFLAAGAEESCLDVGGPRRAQTSTTPAKIPTACLLRERRVDDMQKRETG